MMNDKRPAIWLLCLMLAVGLMLAGCSAPQATAAPTATVDPNAVGTVDGETITIEEVNLLADYFLMQSGMTRADVTDKETVQYLNESALDYAVVLKLAMKKGIERKLYPLSEASQQEVDDIVEQNADYLPDGMTKEQFTQVTIQFTVYQLLYDQTIEDINVTDKEMKDQYDAQVEAQKTSFTADAAAYEQAAYDGSTVIVYKPDGYRYVKHILIGMPEEIANQIDAALSDGDTETAAKLRADGLPQIKAAADAVLGKVKAGGDFDALMAEYGEDPGMQQEPDSVTGYELGSATGFVEEFLEAAMKLEKIGDTTGLVATDFGYHIIKWVGNVPSGPIAYDDVKEDLMAQALQMKQDDAWAATCDGWKAAAKIETDISKIPVVLPSAAATADASTEPEATTAQ